VTDEAQSLPARRPRPGIPAMAPALGLVPRLVSPGELFDASLSPRTLAAYARTWEQWRAWCLGRAVAWHHGPPVTLAELLGELAAMGKPAAAHLAGAWLAELRDAGRKAATLAAYARALTSVTRHAAELGLLPWSLLGVVRAPRGVRVEPARRVVLGADVLGEVAARASADAVAAEDIRGRIFGAVVATLADTAIRTVELVRLRGMDVLADGPHGGPALRLHGKGAMSAPVLHPCTQRALRALRAAGEGQGQGPEGPALPHPRGQRSRGDRAQGIPPGHLTRGVVRQAVELGRRRRAAPCAPESRAAPQPRDYGRVSGHNGRPCRRARRGARRRRRYRSRAASVGGCRITVTGVVSPVFPFDVVNTGTV